MVSIRLMTALLTSRKMSIVELIVVARCRIVACQIERKRMTTRVGYGTTGVLSVETTNRRIIDAFPDGVRAEFETDETGVDWVTLYPADPNGTKCHFHQHGRVHKISITERHLTGVEFEPWRLAKVGEIDFRDHPDMGGGASLQLPNERKRPRRKTHGSKRGASKPFSGTPTPGQRQLPLEDEEPLDNAEAPVNPIEHLRQLMDEIMEIAEDLGVDLCMDENGLLYAKICAE